MNTGQMLLTFGAFVILSIGVLNLNKSMVSSDFGIAQSRYRLEALSLTNTYIQEATQKYFDQVSTDTTSQKNKSNFTEPAALGRETGESINNDFDDYHNLTLSDTGSSGIPYEIRFKVEYVTLQGDSFVVSSQKQYHKRMTIRINDGYSDPLIYREINGLRVKDTLEIEFVNSYWFYN